MVKVSISALAVDVSTNSPVVILKEEKGERVLLIWIGVAEASSIAIKTSNIKVERPLTHDLIKMILESIDAKLLKIEVHDLIENTFLSKLYLQTKDALINIDARPSDAISLAIRCEAPIYVAEKLFEKTDSQDPNKKESSEDLRKRLRDIDPKDFGNFSLG